MMMFETAQRSARLGRWSSVRPPLLILALNLAIIVGVALASPTSEARPHGTDTINAIVGDASWHAVQGGSSIDGADEQGRIRTHLRYALRRLRERDTTSLPLTVQQRRAAVLAALQRYIDRGRFPSRTDDDLPGRRPRFVDDRGTHCAVAYLIADSGEPGLVDEIQRRYEYAEVLDMASDRLVVWAEQHGLSVEELAMIQPRYRSARSLEHVTRVLEASRYRYTLQCARRLTPVPRIVLQLDGQGKRATLSAQTLDPFSYCFVAAAQELLPRLAGVSDSVRHYRRLVALDIVAPQSLLDPTFQRVPLDYATTGCSATSQADPRSMAVTMDSGPDGLTVKVETLPTDPVLASCLQTYLHAQLQHLGTGQKQVHLVRWRRLPRR